MHACCMDIIVCGSLEAIHVDSSLKLLAAVMIVANLAFPRRLPDAGLTCLYVMDTPTRFDAPKDTAMTQ